MIAGILIGLMASLHCIGMCGPIALALPLNRSSEQMKWWGLLQYGIGKTAAYASLGILIGMIGAGLKLLNSLQILSVILGGITIVYGLFKIFKVQISFGKNILSGGVSSSMVRFFKSKSPLKLLFIGFANGLLPCGMVILALTNALLIGSTTQAVFAMIGFGLGTLPILFAVNLVGNRFSSSFKQKYAPMIPYYIVLVGAFIVVRGMNLGIPYISPKIVQTNNVVKAPTEKIISPVNEATVGYSCCSKPKEESPIVK